MTRTSTLIAALGAMLLLVPAAWGKAQPDVVDRAVAQQLSTGVDSTAVAPDVFERAAAVAATSGRTLVFDNHRARSEPVGSGRTLVFDDYRNDPSPIVSSPVASTDSGRELEWPQIGIGIGIGLVLGLMLLVGLRYGRIRPLAH